LRGVLSAIAGLRGLLSAIAGLRGVLSAITGLRGVLSAITGLRREVGEICALLTYYTALCGNSLPTFRDNLSVPSSTVKKSSVSGERKGLYAYREWKPSAVLSNHYADSLITLYQT
jgi:hypothetical protein